MKTITKISIILFSVLLTSTKAQVGTLTGWGMSVCQQFSFSICPGEIITPLNYGTQGFACSLTVMPDVSFVNQGGGWRVAQHNWDFVAAGSGAQISGTDQSSVTIVWPFNAGDVLSPSIYSLVNAVEYITFSINNSAIPFTVRKNNFQIQLTATTTAISANSATICSGQSATLTASGATSYYWNPGNLTGASVLVNPLVTTVYSLTGTNGPCTFGKNQATVTVKPAPFVSISGNKIVCRGKTTNLSASGASSYSWSQGANTSTISVSPLITTSYTVNGTGANGCTAKAVITVSVSDCTSIDNLSSNIQNLSLQIYPNPNNGAFTIETLTETDVTISNTLGQVVLQKQLSEGKNKIELKEQANGIYFVKSKELCMKIIKE
jgi:hypothetical protein